MKTLFRIGLFIGWFLLCTPPGLMAEPTNCGNTEARCFPGRIAKFKRNFDFKVKKQAYQQHARPGSFRNSSITTPASVSTADFASHINVGNQRSFQYAEETGSTIPMDIGVIDETGNTPQTWVLPDLTNFSFTSTLTGNHIKVSDAYKYKEYPETTHAFKWAEVEGYYEYYQLTDFDLFFLGYSENAQTPEEALYDYYSTLSPVPLDLGDEFEGIVVLEYQDDPEADSIRYHQFYDVIGYGTLQTANQGSDDALKVAFTEQEFVFKDGEIVSQSEYSEIVWYSKKGLYVRAGIDDPFSEGVVDLQYIEYQWLTTEVPLAPENLTATANSAGSVLLNWADKSVNESSFEIIRSKSATENADGTFSTIDATFSAPANTTTFTDNTNVSPGTTYYYKVRAKKN